MIPVYANHCPQCGQQIRPSRLSGTNAYPKITAPPSVIRYEAKANAMVVAKPDSDAERLYLIGPGDILPIAGEEEDFYCLRLPGGEEGYVPKSCGRILEVGLGEIEEPFGYIRLSEGITDVNIVAVQPDGRDEILYTLRNEDRFPVVEERENSFMVQLPNKVRGWVRKANVTRTILPSSLPAESSGGGIASALGIAALVGIAMIGGALAGDPEEERIRHGVDRALRDRGM